MSIRTIAMTAIVLAASVGSQAQAQTASKYYMRSQMKAVEAKAASTTPPAPPAVTCGAFEEEMWNTSGTTMNAGFGRIFDPVQQMAACNDAAKRFGAGYCSIYNGDIYYKTGGVKYRQAGRTDLKTSTCQ